MEGNVTILQSRMETPGQARCWPWPWAKQNWVVILASDWQATPHLLTAIHLQRQKEIQGHMNTRRHLLPDGVVGGRGSPQFFRWQAPETWTKYKVCFPTRLERNRELQGDWLRVWVPEKSELRATHSTLVCLSVSQSASWVSSCPFGKESSGWEKKRSVLQDRKRGTALRGLCGPVEGHPEKPPKSCSVQWFFLQVYRFQILLGHSRRQEIGPWRRVMKRRLSLTKETQHIWNWSLTPLTQ